MTREEIEQKMDELARQYAATHAPEIKEEICSLAAQLWEMEKLEKQRGTGFRLGPFSLGSPDDSQGLQIHNRSPHGRHAYVQRVANRHEAKGPARIIGHYPRPRLTHYAPHVFIL